MKSPLHSLAAAHRLVCVCFALCAAIAAAQRGHAASGTWNTNSSSNWNTASNWTPAAVPGTAPGDVVGLNNNISLSRTVTINTNVTLGTLNIGDTDNSASFTLARSSGTFTLDNSGSGAVINQVATSAGDTITAPFTLADNLTVNNNTAINGLITRALTLTGNITQSGGARSLTKTGTGAVILSGSNTYTGGSTISGGALIFRNTASLPSSGTATFGAGTTIGLGVGGSGLFSSANVDSAFGNTLANVSLNANSAIGVDTTAGNFAYTYGGGSSTRSLVKYGANTLTLSGLSTTAANNYSGATVIDQGTLAIGSNAVLTGGLTFGAALLSNTISSLDLSSASATFSGDLLVRTDSASANTITIGAGQSLTTNGNVTIGDNNGATGGNPTTKLTISGATSADGTWNVTKSNGAFRVGNVNGTRGSISTLDMSGLNTFSADLRTTATTGGNFFIGSNSGQAVTGQGTWILAVNSTLQANTLDVRSSGATGSSSLKLGSGTQTLNINTITVGNDQRADNSLAFNSGSGTLRVRGSNGTSAAVLNVGNQGQSNSGTRVASVDLTGHSSDLLLSTLSVQSVGATSGAAANATFSFDSGTLVATTVTVGKKTTAASSAATFTATMNVGGTNNLANSSTITTMEIATMSGTSGMISGTVNIAGTSTTIGLTNLTVASNSSTGGTASGGLNISGGNTTVTNGISLAALTGAGAVDGTISLTGGSLSVGGDILTSAGATSTLTLNGGSLNMNGRAFGDGTASITNLGFLSGALSNVRQINNGADLVKTTSGTLTLTGTSTFTGATAVQAGVVRFNSAVSGTGAQALGSGLVVNLGVAATSTGEIDFFGGGGTLDKNVFALGNGRNRIRNSGGGTLTLSGTLTKNGTILELAQGTFAVSGQITGASANSDLFVNGATVTLSNTNNDYNGPTYVYGGGTLTLGASNVIPNGSSLILGGTGSDSGMGTFSLGTYTEAIGGLLFGSGGGTLRMTASATGATAQLTAASGTMTLTGGTLDLGGSGTSAGYYRLLAAQSIAGSFTSITGTSAAYQVLTTATSIDYQQRAVLGALTVTNPAVSIITGGSAAFTYTVANSAFSGGASLGFSSGSLSANLAGLSSGTASAGGPSTSISGLVFTGTAVGSNQQGTFTVSAPTAYGATSTTGTVSVTVLDHATSSLAGSLLTSTTISLGTWNYATSSWESGGDTGLFSIYNLAGGSGPGLTADLSLLSVTGTAEGFTTNLASYADIAGGTSSQFSVFFDPAGLSTSTTKSTTFQIAMSDKTGMSGATNTNTLFVTANVVVVPEPGALALAGAGVGIAAWAIRMRRPGRARPARAGCGAA